MTGALRLPGEVRIREVGLRDGLQNEHPIPTRDKLELLDGLVDSGARRIEATAFVSPLHVPAMADAEEIAAHLQNYPDVEFSALVPNTRGAERAIASGINNIEYVISASDGHSMANTRRATADAVELVEHVATTVHDVDGQCEVIIAVAWDDPFDGPTDPNRVIAIAQRAVELGADRLSLGDTIGTVTPARMASLILAIRESMPHVSLGLHMHDTRGAGLATIVCAMQLGIADFDASIGGLGGCPFAPGASGNVATEELAYLCQDSGINTGLNLERLIRTAGLAQRLVKRPLDSGVLRAGDRLRTRPAAAMPVDRAARSSR